jgi:hypothetical protein
VLSDLRVLDDDLLRLRAGGKAPNKGANPTDNRPSQEQVQEEDGESIMMVSHHCDDARHEVNEEDDYYEDQAHYWVGFRAI